jgi:pyrimidine-nucleoside phosphorylase
VRAVDLIARKRDGGEHSAAEVEFLIGGYVAGTVADEQMAAWLMAVVWHGLSEAEIDALCAAMVASGDTVDLSRLGATAVDKHSTGGVGDKVTIAVAPLVAACGVPFAKMSGRGLGHTGGTLDKLESIPGFRIACSVDDFIAQVERIGCAVVAQSDRLVPADRLLYALRDVTATVAQAGLIATSVMSKKLAAGAGAIVLDVKVGDGAFVGSVEEGRELARLMQGLGVRAGRRVVCELTRMDAPLGRAVGNALEVVEALDVLRGDAPDDLDRVVRSSAVQLLGLSDLHLDADAAAARVERAIASGDALAAARTWIAAQGGPADLVDDPWRFLPRAPVTIAVPAPRGGVVAGVGALAVGLAAMRLGAGRETKADGVDHAVGIVLAVHPGDRIEAGEPLATVHARDQAAAAAAHDALLAAIAISDEPVDAPDVLIETIA